MQSNGSGVVSVELVLDADAVTISQAAGGTLETRIVTTDLVAGGWEVGAWDRRADGSAALTIQKPFQDPAEVESIYAEITGATGVYSGIRATRDADLVSTRWKFVGTLDSTAMQTKFVSDSELVNSVRNAGADPESVQRLLDGAVSQNVSLHNRVQLPDARVQEWTGQVGARTAMRAESRRMNWTRVALLGAGGALVLIGIAVFLYGEARRHRRRSGRAAIR